MQAGLPRSNTILWLFTGLEASLILLAWGLGSLLDLPIQEQVWWSPADLCLGLAACLPMLLVFWLCLGLRFAPLVRIRRLVYDFIRPLFAGASPAQLGLLCFCAGVGEELLFRGVIQEATAQWLGAAAGLVLASVVFGLLHALTPAYAVLATLLGAYLGSFWLLRGNLLGPMIAHGLYDWVALVFIVKAKAGKLADELIS